MFKTICLLVCIVAVHYCFSQSQFVLHSPDSSLQIKIDAGKKLNYGLYAGGIELVSSSSIDMELENGRTLSGAAVKKAARSKHAAIIHVPVSYKRKQVTNNYSQLAIYFRNDFFVQLRLYNNGMAYRIGTLFKDSVKIINEDASFDIDPDAGLWFAHIDKRSDVDRFHTSFEGRYKNETISKLPDTFFTYPPVTATFSKHKYLISISDAALNEYPGMFLSKTVKGLKAVFAAYPAKEIMNDGEFPQLVVKERENFIAAAKGTRLFPWRAVMVGKNDADLVENDLLYILGEEPVGDFSWVTSAKGTDEWITGINLFNVPFTAGLNTATYKYYIDFAKRFGFDQVMLDAGWSDVKDLFKIIPGIDMNELVSYAKSKNIKLMLWTLCSTLDRQLDSALKQFNKWGVHSIMTDFMDRDDQKTVAFYHRIAKACADNKIAVMFHGAFPPKGFNRTWPNAITQEGVLGAEFNIWSSDATPEHNVTIPYTRMLAGPLDYEPGLLLNAQKDQFRPIGKNPMSIGTRCHQLAMFVVYDSPLQIFSGNISQALMEPGFMELLGGIPSSWDETKILQGKIGEYIITARRKGSQWYIAGMNNSMKRDCSIDLGFLGSKKYDAVICTDGINAHSYGSDYQLKKLKIHSDEQMKLHMAPGGGFLVKLDVEMM